MAEYVELYIDRGTDFVTTVAINDDNTNLAVNTSGYTVSSQLRKSLLSQNASANLTCYISDAANGEITLSMNAANTSNLKAGSYFFDLKVKDNGNVVTRLLEGVIFVTPSITG